MTNPITAFFKELWSNRGRDRDKERLQMMQSTASALESNNKELNSANKELNSAVSRMELQILRMKRNQQLPPPLTTPPRRP